MLPTVTIVTPSLNQGRYLETMLRSVIHQRYPKVEHIIMDGGSTDDSVEILRRLAGHLAYWTTEPDGGQSAAIEDGLRRSTGEIQMYLNADDILLPGAVWHVVRYFEAHPECDALVGNNLEIDAAGNVLARRWATVPKYEALLHFGCTFAQPSVFWRRRVWEELGGFDMSLNFSFDMEFFLRMSRRHRIRGTSRFLSAVRQHPASKTSTIWSVCVEENNQIRAREGADTVPTWMRHLVYEKWRLWRAFSTRIRDISWRITSEAFPFSYCGWQEKIDPRPGSEGQWV